MSPNLHFQNVLGHAKFGRHTHNTEMRMLMSSFTEYPADDASDPLTNQEYVVEVPPDSDNDVEIFYQELQENFDKAPKKDIKIVLGDFNARIGKDTAKDWPKQPNGLTNRPF